MAESLASDDEDYPGLLPTFFSEPYSEPITSKVEKLLQGFMGRIDSFQDQELESMPFLAGVHSIAETEEGWLALIHVAVHTIPQDHPNASAAINIIINGCPLPDKQTSTKLAEAEGLNAESVAVSTQAGWPHLNMLRVLGRLADKLNGPHNEILLTEDVLEYLIAHVRSQGEPGVVLAALVCLENFATRLANKKRINEQFASGVPKYPLLLYEHLIDYEEAESRSLGLAAQWALDNVFLVPGRPSSYLAQDMTGVNVILNPRDSSDNLKVRSNGLEARCDFFTCESTRATFKITRGCWYYEAMPISRGLMHVGWAKGSEPYRNYENRGIGDDNTSVAYDGDRRLLWFDGRAYLPDAPLHLLPPWGMGDVIGCLLDYERQVCLFYLNGHRIGANGSIFDSVDSSGIYPAASLRIFQQCRFNFGKDPFRFPPTDRAYAIMNSETELTAEQRQVPPRQELLAQMMKQLPEIDENAPICPVCYTEHPDARVLPCYHGFFCSTCAYQLTFCPFCRCLVTSLTSPSIDAANAAAAAAAAAADPDAASASAWDFLRDERYDLDTNQPSI